MLLLLLLVACEGPAVALRHGRDSGGVDSGTGPIDTGPVDTGDVVLPPASWSGTGADGPVTVSSDTSSTSLGASIWHAVDVGGASVTIDHDVDGLAAGDEVLVLDVHTPGPDAGDVGVYAFAIVDSVDGATLTTTGGLPPLDAGSDVVVVQRVPQFTDVTVDAELAPPAWDGVAGGVLAFRATGTVHVSATGALHADAKGYLGGPTGNAYGDDGFQGESYAGMGSGGHGGSVGYNGATSGWAANGGGGGSSVTGAGGEYGGGATAGVPWYDGATAPEPGETYGDDTLSRLLLGSGGGGVWNGDGEPGPGGNGAGIVFVAATALVVDGPDGIRAVGETPTAWSQGTYTYGAGGGAGGSVWLQAETADFAEGAVDVGGGAGVSDVQRAGGDGGHGRVRLDVTTYTGADAATATTP